MSRGSFTNWPLDIHSASDSMLCPANVRSRVVLYCTMAPVRPGNVYIEELDQNA